MGKCKFFKKCDYVNPEGYTCNHDDEASGYCGIYKDVERRGLVESLKKK